MADSMYLAAMRVIKDWEKNHFNNPSILLMNPTDVTILAREYLAQEQGPEGSLVTYEQLNPVPMDRLSSGHRFAGVRLDSDPQMPQGKIKVEKALMELAVKAR